MILVGCSLRYGSPPPPPPSEACCLGFSKQAAAALGTTEGRLWHYGLDAVVGNSQADHTDVDR